MYRYLPTPHGIQVLKQHIKELEALRDKEKRNPANMKDPLNIRIKKLYTILKDFTQHTESYETGTSDTNRRVKDILGRHHAFANAYAEELLEKRKRRNSAAAEKFLRQRGINPGDSTLSPRNQADLIEDALKVLKEKNIDVDTYMRKHDTSKPQDLVAGPYTFRMHTKNDPNKDYKPGLYVFRTDNNDNAHNILIHYPDE